MNKSKTLLLLSASLLLPSCTVFQGTTVKKGDAKITEIDLLGLVPIYSHKTVDFDKLPADKK